MAIVQKDLLLDFDLYICERFGYRNSLHVTPTMNGFCVSMKIRPVKLYIWFWEYSNGVGGISDWCIILLYCNFAPKQEDELQGLIRFFKKNAPRGGYKYLGIEDNSRLNQSLGFQYIQSAKGKENYITKLVID